MAKDLNFVGIWKKLHLFSNYFFLSQIALHPLIYVYLKYSHCTRDRVNLGRIAKFEMNIIYLTEEKHLFKKKGDNDAVFRAAATQNQRSRFDPDRGHCLCGV